MKLYKGSLWFECFFLPFSSYWHDPPGGVWGGGAPQRVDPLSSWLGRRRRLNKKVSSIWLKIAKQVAKG